VARRLPIENGSLFENAVKIGEICDVVADSDNICADRRGDRVEHTLAVFPSRAFRHTSIYETDSWNNEPIHGGNVRRVVAQEGSPSLARWPRRSTMYLATLDCAISNPSLSSSP
jgi:hypothetical protein